MQDPGTGGGEGRKRGGREMDSAWTNTYFLPYEEKETGVLTRKSGKFSDLTEIRKQAILAGLET